MSWVSMERQLRTALAEARELERRGIALPDEGQTSLRKTLAALQDVIDHTKWPQAERTRTTIWPPGTAQ